LRLNRKFPELTAEENTSVRGFSPLKKVSVVQQSTKRKKRQAATFGRGSRRYVAFADEDLSGFGTTKRTAE
jgi:hypothetical protein